MSRIGLHFPGFPGFGLAKKGLTTPSLLSGILRIAPFSRMSVTSWSKMIRPSGSVGWFFKFMGMGGFPKKSILYPSSTTLSTNLFLCATIFQFSSAWLILPPAGSESRALRLAVSSLMPVFFTILTASSSCRAMARIGGKLFSTVSGGSTVARSMNIHSTLFMGV